MKTNQLIARVSRFAAPVAAVALAAVIVGSEWRSASAYTVNGPKWPTGIANYKINPNISDASAGTAAEQVVELRAAADTWKNDAQIPFDFVYGGTTAIATTAYDGTNTVYYSGADGAGALAVCNYWFSGTTLLQFDIQYYDRDASYDFIWARNPNYSQFDIRSVGAHEFGHALGMGHSAVGGATMYPSVAPGDVSNRTLSSDDIAGVQSLYGVANPTVSACTPTHGFITGGTALTIDGSHFTANGLTVTIGGQPATSVFLVGPSQITCVVPAGTTAGPVQVQVCCGGACGSSSSYSYDVLRISNTQPVHGSVAQLEFNVPGGGSHAYQAMASLGNSGIPLGQYLNPSDQRSIPLVIDNLFVWPLISQNTWFQNFFSTLNVNGVSYGYFYVPSAIQAVGHTVYFAFIVYDSNQLSGISLVSNGVSATVQ